MFVPEIGQWIVRKGNYDGPGKVTNINFDKTSVTVEFLCEYDGEGRTPISEEEVSITDIETIIIEAEEIKLLDLELEGKVMRID